MVSAVSATLVSQGSILLHVKNWKTQGFMVEVLVFSLMNYEVNVLLLYLECMFFSSTVMI